MSKRYNKIFILAIILSILIIIPTSFAAENGVVLVDNSLDNDYSINNNFASFENEIISEDESSGSNAPSEYYFDSNALDDNGNGSLDSPYKTVSDDRIKSNSILHFARGIYNYTPMNSNQKANITLLGQNSSNTVINNPIDNHTLNVTGIFNIKDITFNNLQIILKNDSILNASNADFYNCTALKTDKSGTSCGGAIYSLERNNTIILNECNFYNNYALYGGAIFTAFADLKITDCQFVNNTAKYYGGAIYQIYGNMSLSDSIFSLNNANDGGAIYIFSKNGFEIEKNSFINNSANSSAGAIFSFYNKNYTISNNIFANNSAQKYNDLYEKSDLIVISKNYTLYRNSYNDDSNAVIYGYDELNDELPTHFNLADYGFVSTIKNQGQDGNCWAFASIAGLESAVIKAIYDMNNTGLIYNYAEYADILELLGNDQKLPDVIDFSEENMKNLIALYSPYGWDWTTNDGGNDDLSMGYLVSWLGPVYEVDDLYGDHSILSPVLSSEMHVQNILFLKRDNFTDNEGIKKAIMKYGAVCCSLGMNVRYDSNIGVYVYNDNNPSSNHEVVLIGWDDDLEIPGAPGKGAWIAKNSWGNWGNGGCFYISYYDVSSIRPGENDGGIVFILNDTIKYDKNYQYDISRTDYFFNTTDTVWYKNVFTATDDEYLSAVSTYFEKPTDWELYVYVNGVLKSTKSGFSNPGYWTIGLFEHILLNAGDIFEIAFKINVTGDVGVPISEYVSLNNEFYKEGISFISYDGKNWADLYDLEWMDYPYHTYKSQVACIKAFTVFDIINTTSSLDIAYDGYNPVNISFNVLNQYGNPVSCGKVLFNLSGQIISVNVSNGVAKLTHVFNFGLNTVFANFVACGYSSSSDNLSLFLPINALYSALDILLIP